ncbi:TonB-dependent receptor plug domain-containing protein [Sphingobium yanoikuyae]|uniref:TonB-dependent receptor n=1 Tax=Sphingobium yanoikuyae TaxID=13690 RepID=A0A085K5X3_SPHYA|nr:TonB-dependent receptor [Sphingobium yanoikuyae]AYO78577.1 TonB-dependent receptor [Sphingobium yanoikuyae]KFD28119.1 TonB-dependent receptor [Sphingobium yanoikuyae]KZC82458.1 TonB-dependent receptor [Sphingobium yanoikuyae]MDV3478430.1 TonB-dependent receptor [Sphingobium yanoikuyae]
MKSIIVSRAALALSLAIASPALADEGEGDSIVVTGTSLEETLPQQLSRYGHAIEIVTDTQIRDAAALDTARALEAVPGLFIRSQSGPFSYVDIALQGSRTKDVLWTMDGIRLNNRLYGGTSPNDTMAASMIERIEVLKGGESLFYGTQAAAGVINVVTRDFSDDLGGQVNASLDSFAGTSLDGYVRGAIGQHRFVVWANRSQSDGYRPYDVMQPSATDRARGYDLWSAGIKYQYDIAPDLRLNALYQHTKADLDNISATRTKESRNDRNEEVASLRLDYTGEDGVQFFLKGYFHDWKTAYVQIRNPVPAGPPQVIYPAGTFWGYQDYGGSAVVQLNMLRGIDTLIGYDFQSFNGRDDVLLIAPTDEQVHAGIFQLRTNDELSSKGRIAAGLRYNKAKGSEKTIWNVSGRYDVSDALFVEANGGTSFVLPDASQLYGNDPCCEVGNPNLKPEESLNLNAALGGALAGGAIRWKATWFNRRITDLIDTTYDDPAFPEGTYINVSDKVRARGAELELNADLTGGWGLSASYTWSRVRNQGSSVQRDRNPEQYGRAAIVYAPEAGRFGANLSANWVGDVWSTASGFGRMNYGNYAVVDAGAHLWLDQARRNRFGVNVENLFDRDYASTGYRSAVSDAGVLDGSNSRFLYFYRGVPRTLRVSYGLSF